MKDGISCSVEIWVQPDHSDIGGTILAFYKPENRIVAFSVHQSVDDLFFQRVTVYRQRLIKSKFYRTCFPEEQPSIRHDHLERTGHIRLPERCSRTDSSAVRTLERRPDRSTFRRQPPPGGGWLARSAKGASETQPRYCDRFVMIALPVKRQTKSLSCFATPA